MEQPTGGGRKAVDLAGVGPTLAEHRDVRKLLEKTFSKDQLQTALESLKTGQLDDPEGFPISAMSCGGVLFVTTPEFDSFGDFRSLDDAVSYIDWNSEDVVEK